MMSTTYSEREQEMFQLWSYIEDMEIATEDEITVALWFGGRDLSTLESLLYMKTGYRSLDQLMEDDAE